MREEQLDCHNLKHVLLIIQSTTTLKNSHCGWLQLTAVSKQAERKKYTFLMMKIQKIALLEAVMVHAEAFEM